MVQMQVKLKMKDICKTNVNKVDEKEIQSNVEMESGKDGDFISGEDSSTGKEDYGQEGEKGDGNQEVACKDEGEGKEEIHKMESSGDISKDEFDSVSELVIDEEMLETVNLTEDTVDSCDPNLDDEDENEDSFPPLSQNVHCPRYVKSKESSESGGDIEQKWAKLPHGKKLQR